MLVAGIDSSTQSCTVVIRDAADGRLVMVTRSDHPRTDPPVSEQHTDSWWAALRDAIGQIPPATRLEIEAIAVDAQAHGLVALDSALELVRPVKLWNDTTSAPQARALVGRLGAGHWAQLTGSVPVAAFTITKLAWLADNEPESLSRTRHVLVPHDWLTYRLTGELVTDPGDASGTGYFDPAAGQWRPELLDLVQERGDWMSVLPRILGPDEAAGRLTRDAARELGLREGIVVGPGTADNQAAAVAMNVRPGDLVFSLGTSGVAYTKCVHPVVDDSGAINGNADATGAYLPVVCTLNATRVTDTFARILGVGLNELGELALLASASDDRLVLSAFLDGERVPDRPDATGTLTGLTNGTTREGLARAAFEGVVSGLLLGAKVMTNAGVRTDGRIAITGGGARSRAYRQLLADLSGRPVHTVPLDESAAAGAAVQAAAVLQNRTVDDVAQQWSPQWDIAAEPRETDFSSYLDRYSAVSAWRGSDRPERSPTAETVKGGNG